MRERRSQRGLTLIELLIGLAIMVMLVGVGVSSLGNITRTQVRTETNRIAAAIRHAYNRSSAFGLYVRMVLDLDAEAYWVEASETPVFLSATKRTEGEGEVPEEEAEDAKTAKDEKSAKVNRRRQSYIEDGVIPRRKMEKPAELYGVITSGQDDVFRSGKAYIHFFPNGFVEPALIYVSDGKESYYTLKVHPMTGKVTRLKGLADPDRDFGEPDKIEQEEQ